MSNLLDTHLKGKRITSFVIYEHSSGLEIEGGFSVNVEGLCRYVGADGAFIVTQDHGHKFGLPTPYDAEVAMKKEILGKQIIGTEILKNTNDVTLYFDTGQLEIICMSSGYETCQVRGPNDLFIVVRSDD